MVSGAQCAEISGAQQMPESLADNWVFQVLVSDCFIPCTLYSYLSTYTAMAFSRSIISVHGVALTEAMYLSRILVAL